MTKPLYRRHAVQLFLFLSLTAIYPSLLARSAGKKQITKQTLTVNATNPGDKAFKERNFPKADSLYTSELQKNPASTELLGKLSRVQVTLGESIDFENTDERLKHYHKAAEYARAAITLDSTYAKGHSWLAASLALMADKIGTKEKIKRAHEIKHELDIALRLNPNDEVALSILGSYYHEASNIGWFKRMVGNAFVGQVPEGSSELAEHAFRKAIALDPDVIRNYHELALIYFKKDREEDAVSLLKTALEKPVFLASDKRRVEEIRKLLKKHSQEKEETVNNE